ncbi:MAG: tetratricopeptide repeat protein [Flavobacteriales bacterium]|nr:tetratricopeptide repeat protein [Flavobacteriales bacterium]MCB9192982.1 tetratricopeptide repeat protein [Flavobacteriales bacterium]
MRHQAVLLVAILSCPFGALRLQAQPSTDEQLAAQYYRNGDYAKAVMYYQRLYDKRPGTYFYEQLFKSYVALKDYDQAERLVKDVMKHDRDPRYPIDLGSLFRQMGEDEKADQQFDKVIRSIGDDANQVRQVAAAFTRNNEMDRALEAYQRGKKLIHDGYSFDYEIANLYAAKGDVPAMIAAYMDLLEVNEGYILSIQNGLSRYLDFTTANEVTEALRTELLRRIQREPDRSIFTEMLIWLYIQQKDLNGAFVQARALDKRFGEGGTRLMELAAIALSNKDYDMAAKCYGYVVGLGQDDAMYTKARIGQVKANYAKLTAAADPAAEAVTDLRDQYTQVLDELGRTTETWSLMEDMAHLQAYYLNDLAAATDLLQAAIDLPGLGAEDQGQLKLELGDVYLFNGNVWDASLLYSQVDLDFKYDPLGHEARLRNAKVSFYTGDFLWCKAQLDVLKASTSKLIANDAMELSLLISDNIGLDSNSAPLQHFARAELLIFQHRYDTALVVLDSLDQEFPMSTLGDDILYQRYRIAKARHQFTEAAGYLQKIVDLYPLDILVDNALYEMGILYEEDLDDPMKAQETYQKLLFDHPGSIFVPEARARFRHLRGDNDEPLPNEMHPDEGQP